MSSLARKLALSGYRWLGTAVYPFFWSYLALRVGEGQGGPGHAGGERYGYASAPRPQGPLVWFHAAVSERTNAVTPLIKEIRRRGIAVVLTTGTTTSARVAAERLGSAVVHQYVPLDFKPAVSRFLEYWQPDLAIIAESEIWPMTIMELGRRHIPQVLVNGRLSDPHLRPMEAPAVACRCLS